jgi:hypothetical protein
LSAGVRGQLENAAKKNKIKLSQEIENRLARSFLHDTVITKEFGDQQLYGLARMVFSAARSTAGRLVEPPNDSKPLYGPPARQKSWLDDVAAFDAAVAAVNKVFELIRPQGDAVIPPVGGPAYQPEFNALETVHEIQKAPAAQPPNASRHMRATISLRKDIGDIVDRAVIRGSTADQTRELAVLMKEFVELRKKQTKTPAKMTSADLNRMNALAHKIEQLQSPSP